MNSDKINLSNAALSKLKKALDELNSGHVNNADPVRFEFIQSLYQGLSKPHNQSNIELIEKIQRSVEQYMSNLSDYRCESAKALESILADFPEQAATAQSLFDQYKFRQVESLLARLIKGRAAEQNIALLRQLTERVNQPVATADTEPSPVSFDRVLYQQERSARQAPGDTLEITTDGRGEQLVMQSMKHFRESMKHFNIDKIISRAINEGLQNPGPLNPQLLAIKSLTQMRDLSPAYLRRFAGYIETMLWLEKNAAKLSNTKLN